MSSIKIETHAGSGTLLKDSEATSNAKKTLSSILTEDGCALLIGGLLIAAVLLVAFIFPGFKYTIPEYQWADTRELFANVLTARNVLLIIGTAIILLFLAIYLATLILSTNAGAKRM